MSGHLKSNRGASLHRLESFSDAVFAFAVTLLVVSLEVPKSVHELFHLMQGFVAFGIAFLLLLIVWFEHNRFFRNFPVTDATIMALNMLLLFVVLLYVYPLKFLFTTLVDGMLWGVDTDPTASRGDVKKLMILYGVGMLALNGVFLCMHAHIWRLRTSLALTPNELAELKGALLRNLINVGVPVLSICIAAFTNDSGSIAGLTYFLLAPLQTWRGFYTARAHRRVAAAPA